MNKIDFMPTFMGAPFYPGGVALLPEMIEVNGRTVREIYFSYIENGRSPADERILRNYILYRLQAPIYDQEVVQELISRDLNRMPFENLMIECLDIGIDPF